MPLIDTTAAPQPFPTGSFQVNLFIRDLPHDASWELKVKTGPSQYRTYHPVHWEWRHLTPGVIFTQERSGTGQRERCSVGLSIVGPQGDKRSDGKLDFDYLVPGLEHAVFPIPGSGLMKLTDAELEEALRRGLVMLTGGQSESAFEGRDNFQWPSPSGKGKVWVVRALDPGERKAPWNWVADPRVFDNGQSEEEAAKAFWGRLSGPTAAAELHAIADGADEAAKERLVAIHKLL